MLIRTAARNIANPTMPEMIPPTKGMYPNIVVIGEKNNTMPSTMQINDRIRITLVKHSDFYTDFSKINSLVKFYS